MSLPPDELDGEQIVGRTQGDALQLVDLVHDHGPDTLQRLMDLWGADHVRRVCIALAAAVSLDRTPQELWGWLGTPVTNRITETVPYSQLWRYSDPFTPAQPPGPRRIEQRSAA